MKLILRAVIGAIRKNVDVLVRTRTVNFSVIVEVSVYVIGILVYRRTWQNSAGPKLPYDSQYSAAWPAGDAVDAENLDRVQL